MLRQYCMLLALWWSVGAASAITIEAPFDSHYAFLDLGEPPGNLGNLGGLTFIPGDTGSILFGARAAGPLAALYRVGLVHGADGHLTALDGTPTEVAKAHGISGGIDGVLFYTT